MTRDRELLRSLDPARSVADWPRAPKVDWAAVETGRTTARVASAPTETVPARTAGRLAGLRGETPGRLRRGRRAALVAVAAGLAAIVAGALITQVAEPTRPAYAATPPPLRLEYENDAPPARDALLELAAAVDEQAGAVPPRSGRFSFVQVAQWSLDFSSGDSGATAMILPQVVSVWRAPDGSGKRSTVSLDPSNLVRQPDTPTLLAAAARKTPVVETYTAGELAPTVTDPAADDVDTLARELHAHQPLANRAVSLARAVPDLYRWVAADRGVRVAALRLLAGTDGVLLRGAVTDRLGREGLAVSVDSAEYGTRDLLIFDRRTGWLLAYESVFLRAPERLPVQAPAVFSYVLYLDQDRRHDTDR